MNKRAESTEIIWMIGIFLYFVVFIAITSGLVSSINQNDYNSSLQDANFERLSANHICSTPRYKWNGDGTSEVYNRWGEDRLFCDESIGMLSKEQCNKISGCTWSNDTKGEFLGFCLFGSCTEYYYCSGIINSHHYGVDNRTPVLSSPRVDFNPTTFGFFEEAWDKVSYNDPDPCTYEDVLFNKTRCDIFSCTWGEYDFSEEISRPSSLRLAFGTMLSFRAPFGFENNRTFGFLTQGFFVWLPILLFLIAFIRLLRG